MSYNGDTGSCGGEIFALKVVGDSMLPEFIDGAMIIIDPEAVVSDGSYVVAEVNQELVLRRLNIIDKQLTLSVLDQSESDVAIPDLKGLAGVVVQQTRRHKNKKRDTRTYG